MINKVAVPYTLLLIIAAQMFSAAFFIGDVAFDYSDEGWHGVVDWHIAVEALATLSLCAAIVFEIKYLLKLLQRKAHLERSLSVASAAVHDVIEAMFEAWRLTPSERDVATFLVKGMSIAEIASLRGSAEGTVKSHLNGVYRKSGTGGRGELLSLIIESLMHDDGADGRGTGSPAAPLDHAPTTPRAAVRPVGALEATPRDVP